MKLVHVGVGIRDSGGKGREMTRVGSVADIVQLPDAEISTDNVTSSLTNSCSGSARPSNVLRLSQTMEGTHRIRLIEWAD
jgi:hypothetical protein